MIHFHYLGIFSGLVIVLSSALSSFGMAQAGEPDTIFPLGKISNSIAGGAQASYGTCPCFRWTVKVELLNGEIETREALISSEAFFRFQSRHTTQNDLTTAKLFRVGALEALLKGAHIGLGFTGVEFGEDHDLGYSNVIRGGLYFILNVLRSEAARFDIRSGAELSWITFNEGIPLRREKLFESLAFTYDDGANRFQLNGDLTIDLRGVDQPIGVQASTSYDRFFRIQNFAINTGIGLTYHHDPFLEALGMEPNVGIANIRIGVSLLAEHPRKRGRR